MITIPNTLVSIGSWSFEWCSSLSQITIIINRMFSSLNQITIQFSVNSIESDTFNGCSSLNQITIPTSVTSIGSGAFEGCSSLEHIDIPSVTMIYNCSFRG